MPYSSPAAVKEGETVTGPHPMASHASGPWSSTSSLSSSPMKMPIEVSPKDRSTPTFRAPDLDMPVAHGQHVPLGRLDVDGQGHPHSHNVPIPHAHGSLPHPEPPLPLSGTSSSSSSNPIFTWPSLVAGALPPSSRDPFDATKSFSEDPFAHRSSESSSGDDYDTRMSRSDSLLQTPMPTSDPMSSLSPDWPKSGEWSQHRPSIPAHQLSSDSLDLSAFNDPSVTHRPHPVRNGVHDPYHSVSHELVDSIQTAIQNLLYVAPSNLVNNLSEEQYAGCSVQMPATSVAALLNTMRGLNYLSANLVPICEGQSCGVRVVREFEVGALVQNIADQLSAEFAQAEVELVLLQQGDIGLRTVNVLGDREGIGYVLKHVVRQILATASKGDTIELGFHSTPQSPRRFSETSLAGLVDTIAASPTPTLPNIDLLCTFEITHNLAQAPDLNAATPKAEVMNPFTRLTDNGTTTPKLDSALCNRLLRQVGAWIKTDATPSSPGFGTPRNGYEISVAVPRGRAEPTPDDDTLKAPFNDPGVFPSTIDLAEFADTLRERKATLFASHQSIFARHMINQLTSLGMDVHVIDGQSEVPPPTSRFVIIDEDVSILRRELARLKPDSLSLRRPLKRPGLFRNSKSTSHLKPPLPTTSIIHFTSIDKYQQVRDVVFQLGAGLPEMLVVPKPVGPRRLLTSLYTAVRQPILDPAFSSIASSPRSPQISSGNRTPTGGPQEGFFDSIDVQTDAAAQKARSPLSEFPPPALTRDTPRPALSTPSIETPASEYFSRASKSTSGAAGVVLKSPDGRPLGVYFEPPGSGRSVSFTQPSPRKPNSRRTSGEHDAVAAAGSPSESLHSSRRASAISTSTDDSVIVDEKDLVPAVVPTLGRRRTLPSPPDGKPILAHGRERSSTVTRQSEKHLPDIAENKILSRPPQKADVVVPPINVLIVEDNPINQNILSMFFRKKKIRHQTAKDGLEAVEKWRTGGFHLILMDIQLPVMDGIEATKEIRKLEKGNNIGVFPSTPLGDHQRPIEAPASSPFRSSVIIVALTASSLQTDRVAALAAGCNDFLTKPVSLKWLEKKTVEWGCMQALIDFEGWRRWKGSDAADANETKRGFQTGPNAAAHKIANRLRIDRHKWRPPPKKDEDKDKVQDKRPVPPT